MQQLEGYCLTCNAKRVVSDPKAIERGGGPGIEGKCTVCGTKVFVLGAGAPVRSNGARPAQPDGDVDLT
jgi:hypothetical protein